MGSAVPPPGRPVGPLVAKVTKDEDVKFVKSVTSVFKRSVNPPFVADISSAGVGVVSDNNSQVTQLAQIVSGYASPATSPPPGLLSYNAITKTVIQLVDWGHESMQFIKTKFGYHMTNQQRLDYLQRTCYVTFNICAGMNLIKNVVGFFDKPAITDGVSKAFSNIGAVALSTLAIFSGIRAINSIGQVFKANEYKSLLGRCYDFDDKIQAMKAIVYVQDSELVEGVSTEAEKKAKFRDIYNQHREKAQEEVNKWLGPTVASKPDIDTLLKGLTSKAALEVYQSELGIQKETLQGLSAEEIMGLLFLKAELTQKKRQDFINTLSGGRPSEGEKIIKAMTTAIKMNSMTSVLTNKHEQHKQVEDLFAHVQKMANRKIMKESAVIVSCVLTIIAAVVTIACPAAFPVVLAMWILSNAIEFGVSLKEFSETAKEKELQTAGPLPPTTTWKAWFDRKLDYCKTNWRTCVSVAVNMVVIALVIASLCTNPITLPLVAGAVFSLLAVALYTYFNACLVHKGARTSLVKTADWVDRNINQRLLGLFGIELDAQELRAITVNKQILKRKILKFDDDRKFLFCEELRRKGILTTGPFVDPKTIESPSARLQQLMYMNTLLAQTIEGDIDRVKAAYDEFKRVLLTRDMQNLAVIPRAV